MEQLGTDPGALIYVTHLNDVINHHGHCAGLSFVNQGTQNK
jgi:hypothetical protein